jgi:uncharacterized protein YjbI with pentapeptide repeats
MSESDAFSPLTRSADSRSETLPERKIDLDLPDLTIHGYQVLEELSHRNDGKRITYVAREINGDRLVVIKEWHMPGGGAEPLENFNTSSLDYADYLPEIERLQQLDHLNIPLYLNSFPTPTGFCVVREYQSGISLAEIGRLPPSDLKLIADAVLDILEYLQYLHPIVIHQNIKPENIIVNNDENKLMVYLVDFSLDPDPSSQEFPGTPGFIPPERIFNRKLTAGSDIYSLGVSLICLLTGTPTPQAQNLLNDRYCPQFRHLLPANTSPQTIAWLEKMVEPNQQGRYFNAASVDSPITVFPVEQTDATIVEPTIVEPTEKIQWWKWGVGAAILLSLGLFLRPFIFPATDELSPAQIAKNQKIAQQAEFEMSDRGKLIRENRCIGCDFKYQNFAKADLTGVVMSQANLNGTNFSDTNLTLAIFRDADLTGANLNRANLQQAALYGAKLIGTKLIGANLSKAKLPYANLKGASLQKANLANANLNAADLSQVDLSNANLTGADLTNADLSDANLQRAILTGAKLNGTKLTRARMPDNSIHK